MKRIIPLLSLFMCILLSSAVWGASWYIDGWDGDDSNDGTNMSTEAFATIKRALDRCSNGDNIYLKGEFLEAPRDTSYSGGDPWDGDVLAQIFVDKSNLNMTRNSGEPFIPVIYGYSPDDSLQYVVRISSTGNTIEDIKFDGYDTWQWNGEVYTHNGVYMTPDADNTTITDCDFTNFGYEWFPGQDDYYFFSIVGGGWPQSSSVNELQNFVISDNDFFDNEFDSKGAHELYLNRASNGTFSGNEITNNGEGTPLKIRDGCHDITFNNNTVYGAHYQFITDHPDERGDESPMDDSYDITVTNNTFTDPNSVIETDVYRGPFWQKNYAAFISEFSGNTVVEGGDREWEVKGVTTNGSKLYMTYTNTHSASPEDNHLVEFGEHNGPVFKRFDELTDRGYKCNGCMCYIGDKIIISTKNGSNIKVYSYDISESTYSTLLNSTTSSYEITAMCPYNSSYFITALRYYNSANGVWYAKIYKSTGSNLLYHKIYEQPETTVNSVTAVAVSGSTLIFGAYINSSSSKIYSGSIPSSGEINESEEESLSDKVTGLTYKSSTLMTALQDGTSTKIYSGTTSEPLDTLRETYTSTNLIALESDSEFIFMVKDNTGDADEERTVYFTDSTTNMDEDIIYHSKWYTSRF